MDQDNTEEEDVTPEAEAEAVEATATSDVELAALGSSLAASGAGSLAGGAFGTPGGPAAGAILLGLIRDPEEPASEVNPPSTREENA